MALYTIKAHYESVENLIKKQVRFIVFWILVKKKRTGKGSKPQL
jgi:hypothetical protein